MLYICRIILKTKNYEENVINGDCMPDIGIGKRL